jgi:hypothetical protein
MLNVSAYKGKRKIRRLKKDPRRFYLDDNSSGEHIVSHFLKLPFIGNLYNTITPIMMETKTRKDVEHICEFITDDFVMTMIENKFSISVNIVSGLDGGTVREFEINNIHDFKRATYTDLEGHFPVFIIKYDKQLVTLDIDFIYSVLKSGFKLFANKLDGGTIFFRKSDGKVLYLINNHLEEYRSVEEFTNYRG